MLNIQSVSTMGVLIEIAQEGTRSRGAYVVYADGKPIGSKRTIIKAKREANAFVGEHMFDIEGAHCHA